MEKSINNNFACQEGFYQVLLNVCIEAAKNASIACFSSVGKGDKQYSDFLAVEAMRKSLNSAKIKGRVVIGEGEMDEAPMLYIGEVLGCGDEILFDIAVDPLEGTNLCAKNMPNSMTSIAVAKCGDLLNAPDCYMQKIASGRVFEQGVLDIDFDLNKNLSNLCEYLNKSPSELNVVMLDRQRHADILKECRDFGAKVTLLSDGDIFGVISTTKLGAGDLYIGSGGAPEGVLAACGIKTCGGFMQARLMPENDLQKQRITAMTGRDFDHKLLLSDMVKGDSILTLCGVTQGDLLNEPEILDNGRKILTHTIVFNSLGGREDILDFYLEEKYNSAL